MDHRHREHTVARNSERVCGGGQTGRVWGTFVQTQNMFNTIGGSSVSYELYLMTYQHWFTNDNKSVTLLLEVNNQRILRIWGEGSTGTLTVLDLISHLNLL